MKRLLIIDGNSLLFRAFFATYNPSSGYIMKNKEGVPTNAIFAFSNMLTKILGTLNKGDGIFVGFDADSQTFRKEQYPNYKANREKAPEELIPQFTVSRELLDALGVCHFELHGVEADDICGSIAKMASSKGIEVTIYTSDKDYLQLIDGKVKIILLKKGLSETNLLDASKMEEEFGFKPSQLVDYKGLRGDPSDNLPGINGVGEKTAVKLLNEYGDFEAIIKAAKEGLIPGKMGEKIVQGETDGRVSRDLAQMKLDVELPFTVDDLPYKGYELNKVSEFAARYELKQLVGRLPGEFSLNHDVLPEIKQVNSIKGIKFPSKVGIALDIDIASYLEAPLLGVSIYDGKSLLYLPYEKGKDDGLKELLEDPSISKNSFDQKCLKVVLNREGIAYQGAGFDLMLAAYLLDSSLKEDPVASYALFGSDITPEEKQEALLLFDNKEMEKTAKMAFYAYTDEDKAISKMKENNCLSLYNDIETPLSLILAKMEIEGFPVDKEILLSIGEEFRIKKEEAEKKAYELAGLTFNISSPKQVGEVLFNKLGCSDLKKGSTSVEVLQEIAREHPLIPIILEYRKYTKLLSTYIDGLLPHIKEDNKIHTHFHQGLASTGRLSSSDPNLQNIATRDEESKGIKKAFYYPDENLQILSLDYGQIELRILSQMACCQSYIDVFSSERDIHVETARKIFHLPEDKPVPSVYRRKAKAVNFAIIYGTTPFGLSQQIGCSLGEAKEAIDSFYSSYPEIAAYRDKILEDLDKNGYVETMNGRRRYLAEATDANYNVRMAARRAALNAPIQGSAADLIKLAMIKVDKFLNEGGYKTKMVLQIHDELLFAIPKEESFLVEKLKGIMEKAMDLKVKLTVEGGIGQNWYEVKE